MGTTAEKLTYLNDTKSLLKTAINYTGANITNDTFRSYPKKLKDAYIDIINNGTDTLYSNFPKVSGTGTNISLTPTYEAPMEIEYKGQTSQDGTPTPDSPIPIENVTGRQVINSTGKNLFDINKLVLTGNYSISGNNLILTSSTDYHSTSNDCLLKDFADLVVGQTYTLTFNTTYSTKNYIYLRGSNSNWNNGSSITITQEILNDRIAFYGTNDTVISNIMIVKGTTLGDYEPYKNNSYEVNLGKNLFNSTIINGVVGNTGITTYSTRICTQDFIKVQPNETYTLSFTSSTVNQANISYFASNDFPRSSETGWLNNFTFTIPSDINYILISFRNSNNTVISPSDISKVQLEKGTQASSYSPYFTPIELNKIGDYEDRIYKDNGKWYLEKNIGKVVLDGSEDWGLASNYTNNSRFSSSSLILGKTTNLISNYFVEGQGGTDTTNIDTNGTTGALMITIPNSIATTLSQFTTWLSTHNTIVYYVLATPTTTEITNTELIEDLENLYNAKSKSGTTNISSSSENLPVILSVSALKGE